VDTSRSGKVRRAALAASQVDWRHLQQNNVAEWLDIAHRAFAALDKDKDGVLRLGEIMASIRAKLPEDELQGVIHQALQEAGVGPGGCARRERGEGRLAPGWGSMVINAVIIACGEGVSHPADRMDSSAHPYYTGFGPASECHRTLKQVQN
jgi:hypothetical protein